MKNILLQRLDEEYFFFKGLMKNILLQRLDEEYSSSKAS
jgi:hypothetical protein